MVVDFNNLSKFGIFTIKIGIINFKIVYIIFLFF